MIAWRAEDSLLLQRLLQSLPLIRAKLDAEADWDGIRVREPEAGDAYLRAVCRDVLVSNGGAEYRVGVHAFDQPRFEGRLHNHRWPLAVLPLAEEGAPGEPLYEMPWEVRRDGAVVESGSRTVRSGEPYAFEDPLTIFHAVVSRRPHLSIVFTDVSAPPARENRMQIDPLPPEETCGVLRRAARALRG